MNYEVGLGHRAIALAFAASACVLSGCTARSPSAFEMFVGGEWVCREAKDGSRSNRLTFQSDGTWKNRLVTGGPGPDGVEVRIQFASHGTYKVEGDQLWTHGRAIDSITITRNGVTEPVAPDIKAAMEIENAARSEVPTRFRFEDQNRFVLIGDASTGENMEQACTR